MNSMSFTGHRPSAFMNEYNIGSKIYADIIHQITQNVEWHIVNKGVTTFYTGGAQGIDTICFFVVHKLKSKYPNIKNILCIPFDGFNKRLVEEDKWFDLCVSLADQVIDVSKQGNRYNAGGDVVHQLQLRNEYMVDNSQYIIAVFVGGNGGAHNCIKYAKSKSRIIKTIYVVLEGQMKIVEVDNSDFINKKLMEDIKACLVKKDFKQMNDYCEYLKKLVELQGQPSLQFDGTPLDTELSKLKVKNIFGDTVEFDNDTYDIVITLKAPRQLTI